MVRSAGWVPWINSLFSPASTTEEKEVAGVEGVAGDDLRAEYKTRHKTAFFLLDVSGSMAGDRLKAATAAILKGFDLMQPYERFSFLTFNEKVHMVCTPEPVEKLRRRGVVKQMLDKSYAGGMTALYDAIATAVEQIHDKTIDNHIIVVTDGEDNSSCRDLSKVLALVSEYPKLTLDIVHIDDTEALSKAYASLCSNRGEYTRIASSQIEDAVGLIVRKRIYVIEETIYTAAS